jgi:hypothetical protein
METFLSALKAAPKSSTAKINIFLTYFNPRGSKGVIFLEGKRDPSFIRANVEKFAADAGISIETIIFTGKSDVLKAWCYLEKRFPKNPRILFFVDKDHDDLLGKISGVQTLGNLFVTQYYSVENYLVTKTALEVVLIDIWGLDSTSGVLEPICKAFEDFKKSYRLAFLPWMAWHLAARRLNHKPNIGNVKASILNVHDDFQVTLNWQPDMESFLESKCHVSTSIEPIEITKATDELKKLPTKSWLRGKQEIWCFIAFLDKIVTLIDGDSEIEYAGVSSKLNSGNVVEFLAPRLPCPSDLESFLREKFKAIKD